MRNKYFSNLENKYYYGISRTFWHIFAVFAVIGFIVGIGIIGWSYLPSSKKEVFKAPIPEKQAYPTQVRVEINEILNALPKDKVKIEEIKNKSFANAPKIEPQISEYKIDTTGLSIFEKQIANLKNLLPYKVFQKLWNGKGYYTYPRGEALYKIKKLESYRKYVSTSPGLLKKIENRTNNNEFTSYIEKAELVQMYNRILQLIDKKNRIDIIHPLTYFKNKDFNKTINSFSVLYNILQLYNKDEVVKGFERHSRFLRRNPSDGIGLLTFELEALKNFTRNERYSASNIIEYEYVNYYNNNLGGIKENTLNFIPFLKKIDIDKQSIALNYYYKIYKSKNIDRRQQIQRIDNEFNQQIEQINADFNASKINAEVEFQNKQQKTLTWRSDSLKIIAAALGTILLITLILLLLSMIRNVNKLAQAMLESNKNKSN